ncbi:MAG: ATP-dependent zinc metalloprotease FtsH [Candidatus Nealsonbacteria bacterium]|nr:ATP-dependent zinc metalloprotease FtsH [Candidatus Nealsonbacteria bacterium]
MKKFNRRRFLILILIFLSILVILAGFGIWRFNSSQQTGGPTDTARSSDELIAEEIANKYNGEINITKFKRLLDKDEVGTVYFQNKDTEWGTVVLYFIKLRGEKGYYLAQATPGTGYALIGELGNVVIVPLNDYLSDISSKVYNRQIDFKLISATPKLPFDKNQLIIQLAVAFIILIAVVLAIWLLWGRMARGGLGGFNKLRKREVKATVTFDEIAGIDEAKNELREVVDFLKNREHYKAVKAKVPKGVMLIGPPGTGKTMLAEAVAHELGKESYLSLSGSEFVEMFVGVGAARVRDLFDEAHKVVMKTGYCVVFLDEVEALGGKRGHRMSGGNEERESATNEIMVRMDGIGSDERIIILAATNRPDMVDEAFMRPGRFDRKIIIDYPDAKGREAIFRVHCKGKPIDEDVNFTELARSIPLGSSGADIANIVNEAAIYAGRKGKKQIGREDFQNARDKIRFGLEKKGEVITGDEKRVYAYHEAGHALAAKLLPNMPPLGKVSILRRGLTHGVVEVLPEKDQNIKTKQDLLNNIIFALASVAAEEEIYGGDGVTTGAYIDIKQATKTAIAMVSAFGMSEEFGLVSLEALQEGGIHFLSAKEVIDAVNKINSKAKGQAQQLIKDNRPKLDALADALIELEDIDGKTAEKIIEQGKYPLD